jgi:thioesterase domain-containing protein
VAEASPARVTIQPGTHARPLFLVHPGEGTVLCYRELAAQLGAHRPVYAFEAQASSAPGPAAERIPQMAERYLAELRQVQPSGPYLLGGWSFGGLVAFEMAQRLLRAGERVEVLALLDTVVAFDAPPPLLTTSDLRQVHAEAAAAYAPSPYAGAISLFRAHDTPPVPDPTLGWRSYATQPIELTILPGDHWSMVREPHVHALGESLRRRLDAADAEHPFS